MSDTLLIRADGGPRLGTGHVMRCLALAHAWQDTGGRVACVMAPGAPNVQARLAAEHVETILLSAEPATEGDAIETCLIARRLEAAWLVLDGYQFRAEYQRAVKQSGLRLLAVDDFGHAEHYWADVVLNQDVNADERFYRQREPYTRLLLGTRYVLLRREFLAWPRRQDRGPEIARKLLVTLGGADPDNVTRKVIDALKEIHIEGLEAQVVVGPSNPRYTELEALAADALSSHGGTVRVLPSVTSMPALMAWSDMAVTAAGSTIWELALFAVPCIALIVSENQALCAKALGEAGACLLLGESRAVDRATVAEQTTALAANRARREAMGRKISAYVDGRGARRVCDALGSH